MRSFDVFVDVGRGLQIGHATEDARAVQPGQQIVGRHAAVLIEHGVRNVVQIVGGRIAVDEALNDRRNEQAEAALRVLEHREKFFSRQSQYTQQCIEHGILKPAFFESLCASTAYRSTAAIPASTAAAGRITPTCRRRERPFAAARHKYRAGIDVGDQCSNRGGHAPQVEQKTREHHRRQKRHQHRHLAGDELASGGGRNQQADRTAPRAGTASTPRPAPRPIRAAARETRNCAARMQSSQPIMPSTK